MYKIERVFSEGGGLEMNGKLPKKAAIVGIVFVCCMLGLVNYRLKPIENMTPENVKEDEELWWGESGTAFIHESEIKVKDPALLDDTDRDWIDVDGLRDLSNGKAALIDDTNREWIGKEVMINAMVVHGSEMKEITEEEAEENAKALEKNRLEKALDNDYIKSVDAKEFFLPATVNPFLTTEKDGYYETPEVIMGGAAMVIFTKPDGTAWYLKKGETLSFEAEQYPLETTKTRNKNWKIKFGYLLDGALHQDIMDEGIHHQYNLTAEQEGEYYMTIYCASGLLTLKNGRMEIK